jgi:hypothetical protein
MSEITIQDNQQLYEEIQKLPHQKKKDLFHRFGEILYGQYPIFRLRGWIQIYNNVSTSMFKLDADIVQSFRTSLLNEQVRKYAIDSSPENLKPFIAYMLKERLDHGYFGINSVIPYFGVMTTSLTLEEYQQLPMGIQKLKMMPSLQALLYLRYPTLNIPVPVPVPVNSVPSTIITKEKEYWNTEINAVLKRDFTRSGLQGFFNPSLRSYTWWAGRIVRMDLIYRQDMVKYIFLFMVDVEMGITLLSNGAPPQVTEPSDNDMRDLYFNGKAVYQNDQLQRADKIVSWWNDLLYHSGKEMYHLGIDPLFIPTFVDQAIYIGNVLLETIFKFMIPQGSFSRQEQRQEKYDFLTSMTTFLLEHCTTFRNINTYLSRILLVVHFPSFSLKTQSEIVSHLWFIVQTRMISERLPVWKAFSLSSTKETIWTYAQRMGADTLLRLLCRYKDIMSQEQRTKIIEAAFSFKMESPMNVCEIQVPSILVFLSLVVMFL